MMPARVWAKERCVEHVREPSQRMPVRRVKRRECPLDGHKMHAWADERILVDVDVVVEIDEIEPPDLDVDRKTNSDEPSDN